MGTSTAEGSTGLVSQMWPWRVTGQRRTELARLKDCHRIYLLTISHISRTVNSDHTSTRGYEQFRLLLPTRPLLSGKTSTVEADSSRKVLQTTSFGGSNDPFASWMGFAKTNGWSTRLVNKL